MAAAVKRSPLSAGCAKNIPTIPGRKNSEMTLQTDCTPPEVSVIVPAFNEAEGIARFLAQLFAVLQRCCASYEVWVIDDGSRDATWERLQAEVPAYPCPRAWRKPAEMAASLPKLRVKRSPQFRQGGGHFRRFAPGARAGRGGDGRRWPASTRAFA